MNRRRVITALLLSMTASASAAPHPVTMLAEVIPADSAVVYFNTGAHEEGAEGSAQQALVTVSLLTGLANQTGLLSGVDPSTRLWLDLITSLPLLMGRPHAIALLDVRAKSRGRESHRLESLQLAIVVNTDGDNAAIEQRIQQLLSMHTNREDTVLSTTTIDQGSIHSIRDRRLPDWATISWGAVNQSYVIAFGVGTAERIIAAASDQSESLASDSWFQTAWTQMRSSSPLLGCYLNFDRLEEASDEVLQAKVRRIRQALTLGDAQCSLWVVSRRERAVEIDGVIRRDGRDVHRRIADSRLLTKIGENTIPQEAGGFAILDVDPRIVVDAIGAAYLAARSPAAQASSQFFWSVLQARSGVSIQKDILSHLGRYVVVHDHPRHALGLPLLWTFLFKVKDDSAGVRKSIDRLLTFVQQELADAPGVQLRREHDGVWFVHLGIQGPALAVTPEWVVISFSPQAVRTNVELLREKTE